MPPPPPPPRFMIYMYSSRGWSGAEKNAMCCRLCRALISIPCIQEEAHFSLHSSCWKNSAKYLIKLLFMWSARITYTAYRRKHNFYFIPDAGKYLEVSSKILLYRVHAL